MKFLNYLIKLPLFKKFYEGPSGEDRVYFTLTLITGVLAGLVAVFLKKSTHYLTHLIGTYEAFTPEAFGFGLAAIFASGYLTTRHFPSTSGSGIPETRVSLAVFGGKIPFKATIAKAVTTILTLTSGFSLGLEGPTVRVASGFSSILGHLANLPQKKIKALVAIGTSGGIAAAFNTPMAAVVFTLEEVVGDLNAKLLGPIIISSVMASVVAMYFMGKGPVFADLHYQMANHKELLIYLVVGLLAAIMGPLWVKSVLTLRKFNLRIFRGHRLTIIVVTFFIMAFLAHYNSAVLGSGHDSIVRVLLSLVTDWKILLLLFALKFFATTICYASGASGGLFMPTLFIGACLGGVVGSLAKTMFPELGIHIGAYALVGMGAFFASVIRAPFSSILIVFEMTRDYNIIMPLMIANITSYVISSKIHEGSVYENISEQDGIHLPTRDDHEILENLIVEDAMVLDPITLNFSLKIKEGMELIKNSEISGYPVLKNGFLHGIVSSGDMGKAFLNRHGEDTIDTISTKSIIKIFSDQSLLVALHKLNKHQVSRLPVVSRINDKKLVGIITAEDIVNKFGYHIEEESKIGLIEKYEKEYEKELTAQIEKDRPVS